MSINSTLLIISAVFALCAFPVSASGGPAVPPGPGGDTSAGSSMDTLAEEYVRLALALGNHDPSFIDAYYGPEEWKKEAAADTLSLAEIIGQADSIMHRLEAVDVPGSDEMAGLRKEFLLKQTRAVGGYARILSGEDLSFDEQTEILYDAVAPHLKEGDAAQILKKLDSLLPPGNGAIYERLEEYRKGFVIPSGRLKDVFSAAIKEARKRTREHIKLPDEESFDVEYVTGTSWGAYNWYKGNAHSLIQVNTDLPSHIDSPLRLACHEGYPGHHVYNVLLEQNLVRKRGWVEFTVYPLFSPQSLLAEGTANFGIEAAFPGEESLDFEKKALYPLAGLDPSKAEVYEEVNELARKLARYRLEAARMYIDGRMDAGQTAEYLSSHALLSPDRARKLVDFFDQFGSYIINYYEGYDLVKAYIERNGGTAGHPDKVWEIFTTIIDRPRVPSQLR